MPGSSAHVYVDDFNVYIDDAPLSQQTLSSVTAVRVEYRLNLPTSFTIEFNSVNFEKGTWQGIDLKLFKPGATVKIFIGVFSLAQLITGEITSIEPVFGENSRVYISGYDRLYSFFFGRLTRGFTDKTDSEIASSIATEDIKLKADVSDTSTTYPFVGQYDQSNYHFVLSRAKRNNYEISVTDNTFYFRPTKEGQAADLTLTYDVDLSEFRARMRILTEGSSVDVRGWDSEKKEVISSLAWHTTANYKMGGSKTGAVLSKTAYSDSAVIYSDEEALSVENANDLAQAYYNQSLNSFIEGSGECAGNPQLLAGANIELKGLDDSFSGRYYVTHATHQFSIKDGYTTRFQVRRTGI